MVFDRKFTKSLMIRDFDDVLKNPLEYVDLFLLYTLLSKKITENRRAWPVTEGPKLQCNNPPLWGLASDIWLEYDMESHAWLICNAALIFFFYIAPLSSL